MLAMVPATSASSTIDRSLVRLRIRRQSRESCACSIWRGRGRIGQASTTSRALSANGRVLAALDDGRSISCRCGGGSPISLRPTAAAVEPLNAIARELGEFVEQLRDPIVLGERGSPGRGCRCGSPRRSRPTSRCRGGRASPAARHTAKPADPRRSRRPAAARTDSSDAHNSAAAASEASPGRLPRMNSRASGRAIGGKPALTLTKKPLQRRAVQPSDLRVALFSGNYNYVRDGANQALNRLVGYLLRQGVARARLFADGREPRLPADRRPGRDALRPDPRPVRISAAHRPAGAGAARPRRIQSERRPRLQPRYRRPPRGELGPAQQDRSSRLGSHAVRDLPCLLPSAVARARGAQRSCAGSTAAARWCGAGRIDRGDPSRPAHEPRHRDLVARGRPRPVQPRPARHGVAPLASGSPTTKWSSPSSAGW